MVKEKEMYIDGIPGTEQLLDIQHNINEEHVNENSEIILIPQPTDCTGDPLRWKKWKKYYQLAVVSYYAACFSFGENTLGASWETVADDIGVNLTNMNGGSALNYLLLGFCNIFWIPAAMKFGRKPVFIITTIFVITSACWTSKLHGVVQWMFSCILNGLGTSAYEAVIQLTVFDLFFVHERGRMLAIYIFGQQLGSVVGLISGGKISDSIGWRWSQYLVAIVNSVCLLLFLFTFEETLFPRFLFNTTTTTSTIEVTDVTEEIPSEDDSQAKQVNSSNIRESISLVEDISPSDFPQRSYLQSMKLWIYYPEDKTTYWEYFRRPFLLILFPNIVVAAFQFAFGCTAGIISFNTISEILSGDPYDFSSTSVGLMCFGAFIGNIVGWATGSMSDFLVIYLARRNHGIKEPEMRLYAMILPFCYAVAGYMMYGWGAESESKWPVISVGLGCMIAHQVSACSIATSYAMDCYRGVGGELVVVLAMCSSCINFAFSYSVQPLIDRTNYGWACFFFGILVAISVVLSIPTIMFGKRWRIKCADKYYKFVTESKGKIDM